MQTSRRTDAGKPYHAIVVVLQIGKHAVSLGGDGAAVRAGALGRGHGHDAAQV